MTKHDATASILLPCACGCEETPNVMRLGIGVEEYDEIECQYCHCQVRQKLGAYRKAEEIWNSAFAGL